MTYGKDIDEISLKILSTANALFIQHGVEDVSMHQVAKTAGIGQGTLYRRYPNKSKLCFAIMKSKFDFIMADIEDYLLNEKDRPIMERMFTLIKKIVVLIQEDMEWLMAATCSERLEEAKENCYEAPPFTYIANKMNELLEEAARHGELIDLDPAFASRMIASSFSPMLLLHLQDLGYSSTQVAEEYCHTFIAPLFSHKQI
ncbi:MULTISPECIES: TetR/AcrR family transcriptional regulator [unclassified Paenibacillus]|uniref:TetR/AcrR family transcriptional regulator n=1 Tax=unclassified Paenibacillus TaxID=185978 RepID=UPI002F3ED37E